MQINLRAKVVAGRGATIAQTLKIMKLTILLITITFMQVSAKVYSQINLTARNVTLESAFAKIEKQSGYSFFYNENLVQNITVSTNLHNASLKEAMDALLDNQPLTYVISGQTVVIKKKEPSVLDKIESFFQLPHKITGRVTDQNGAPLPGASILVKGGNVGATSNEKGDFVVSINDDQTVLVVRFLGYITREIPVTSTSDKLVIKLLPNDSKLDEVQVIAYGTTTERLNTGNVTTIKSEEIMSAPISNPLAALEGRVPGMTVSQVNGLPGAPFKVQIEGQNTLSSTGGAAARVINSDPLYIVDGIPFAPSSAVANSGNPASSNISVITSALRGSSTLGGLSPFSTLNPEDIESITVLKDADATAIYGSRGGNGVVLITTKKGKAGKTTFNANVYSGYSVDSEIPNMMNTQQYLAMRNEAFKNDGVTPTASNAPDLFVYDQNKYTNFPKMFLGGKAHITDAQGSLTGGNENTTFLISGGYHQEGTIFPGDNGMQRASFHAAINHTSTDKKFSMTFTTSFSHSKNTELSTSLAGAIGLAPNTPDLIDGSGHLVWTYNGVSISNPLAYLYQPYVALTDNLVGSMVLNYQILPGLTVRANLGYNRLIDNETEQLPVASQNPQFSPSSVSYFGTNNFTAWNLEPQLEYTRQIAKGKFDVLVGGTWQYNKNDNSNIQAVGYSNDALLGSLAGASYYYPSSDFSEYKYQAVFGRINYNWDNKYILNLTARRDGSSRFGADHQFSNFGALGAAWLFSNESFFKDYKSAISTAKLRFSYGVTGTDPIGNYNYLDTWSATNNSYNGSTGLYPLRLANPNYSWEKNNKAELGLELGFLNDRITFGASGFINRSSNHLISYPEPAQTGFSTITENFPATIQNKGLEFTVYSRNITGKDFNWTTSANITFQANKLVSFPNIQNSAYATIYQVGQSLQIVQGYLYQGVDPATGLFKFQDTNHDGVLNASDNVILGDLTPKFYGGMSNTFNYKRFSFNFFVEFKKQTGLNYLNYAYSGFSTSPGAQLNMPVELLNRWQNPGDNAEFAKYSRGTTIYNTSGAYTGLIISDASYLRFKSASLSYSLPDSWTKRMHVQGLRLYVQGGNLFTITGYKEADPETQSLTDVPPLRTLTAGIQLTL